MDVVLAVNVEAVKGRNMSNVCAHNRSQKRRFMMLYYGLLCFICILLPLLCCTVYLSLLLWNSNDPRENLSYDAIIMNNNVLLHLYCKDREVQVAGYS